MDADYIGRQVDRWKKVLASKFASASAKVKARKELKDIKQKIRAKGFDFR